MKIPGGGSLGRGEQGGEGAGRVSAGNLGGAKFFFFRGRNSHQTLAGIAPHAPGESVKNFPAASKFAGKLFQRGISDSHSLL